MQAMEISGLRTAMRHQFKALAAALRRPGAFFILTAVFRTAFEQIHRQTPAS
jgi:hypothetical protein